MSEQLDDDLLDPCRIESLGKIHIHHVAVDVDMLHPAPGEQSLGKYVRRIFDAGGIVGPRVVTVPLTGQRAVGFEPDHTGAGTRCFLCDTDGLTHVCETSAKSVQRTTPHPRPERNHRR